MAVRPTICRENARLGDRRTRELMLTNRVLSADEALDWGVVNQVVADEDDNNAEHCKEACEEIGFLAKGATQAFGQVKSLLDASFDHSLETQIWKVGLEARGIGCHD